MGLADYIQTQTQIGVRGYRSPVYGNGFQPGIPIEGVSLGATDPLSTVDWVEPTLNGLQNIQNRFSTPLTNVNLTTFVVGPGGGDGTQGPQGPRGPTGAEGPPGPAGIVSVVESNDILIREGDPTITGDTISWPGVNIRVTGDVSGGVLTLTLLSESAAAVDRTAEVCS